MGLLNPVSKPPRTAKRKRLQTECTSESLEDVINALNRDSHVWLLCMVVLELEECTRDFTVHWNVKAPYYVAPGRNHRVGLNADLV